MALRDSAGVHPGPELRIVDLITPLERGVGDLGEIKKLSVKTHPDQNHDSETAAIIQTLLNDLATQLRKVVRTNTKR